MCPPCVEHAAGEIRGQVGLPKSSTSVNLFPLQQPYAVLSSALGVASVVVTGTLTVNVSLQLFGVTNQTRAHLHTGGTLAICWFPRAQALHHSRPQGVEVLRFLVGCRSVGDSLRLRPTSAPGAAGPLVCLLPTGNFVDFTCNLTGADFASLMSGMAYINIHTTAYPQGPLLKLLSSSNCLHAQRWH